MCRFQEASVTDISGRVADLFLRKLAEGSRKIRATGPLDVILRATINKRTQKQSRVERVGDPAHACARARPCQASEPLLMMLGALARD